MHTYTLVNVRDPEDAHQLLERAGIGIDRYEHDPATRRLVFETPVARGDVQVAVHRQGLHLDWTTLRVSKRHPL